MCIYMANFHYMVKCPKAHSKLKHYSPSGRNASLIKVVLSCARKEENVEIDLTERRRSFRIRGAQLAKARPPHFSFLLTGQQ